VLRRVLLALLAFGVAGCVLILTGGLSSGRAAVRAAVGGAGLMRVLPGTDRVLTGPSLAEVNGLADGMGSLWLTGGAAGRSHVLYAVSPVSSQIDATITLPSRLVINPGDLAVGPDAVWVAVGPSIYRVVPGLSGRSVTRPFATLPHADLIGDVVTTAGAVWVDDTTRGTVYRYAAGSGRLEAAVPVGRTAGVLAAGDGGVWAADPDGLTVSRISLTSNRVDAVVHVPGAPTHLAAAGDRLWLTDGTDSVRVVGPGGQLRSVHVAGQPTGLSAVGGSVWVASTGTGTLSRIDARRDAVLATVRVGERPYAVAATPQGVWVAVLGQPVMMHTGSAPGSAKLGWLLRLCGIG
jgi:YVTN family beta-propeller protein